MFDMKFNSADKSANITLSGGDFIATAAAGGAIIGVRGTQGRGAVAAAMQGKFIFEVTINAIGASNKISVGVGSTTAEVLTTEAGNHAESMGYRTSDHWIEALNNGTLITPSWAQAVAGDVLGVEFDNITSDSYGAVKVYKNGVETATVVFGITNTPSAPYPLITLFDINDQVMINFGATPFAFEYPHGTSPYSTDVRPVHPMSRSKVQSSRPIHHIRL